MATTPPPVTTDVVTPKTSPSAPATGTICPVCARSDLPLADPATCEKCIRFVHNWCGHTPEDGEEGAYVICHLCLGSPVSWECHCKCCTASCEGKKRSAAVVDLEDLSATAFLGIPAGLPITAANPLSLTNPQHRAVAINLADVTEKLAKVSQF